MQQLLAKEQKGRGFLKPSAEQLSALEPVLERRWSSRLCPPVVRHLLSPARWDCPSRGRQEPGPAASLRLHCARPADLFWGLSAEEACLDTAFVLRSSRAGSFPWEHTRPACGGQSRVGK